MTEKHAITTYTEEELEEFDKILDDKISITEENCLFLQGQISNNARGTDDTSYSFNLMDDGQVLDNKENLFRQLARENKFLESLRAAKQRIKNKTYGICRVTGKLIGKERLRAVPHTTLSVEGKEMLEKRI